MTVARPFQEVGFFLRENAGHLYGEAVTYEALRLEREALLVKVSQLEGEIRESAAALAENARLRELLDLRAKRRDFQFEAATILARSPDQWRACLTIGKGEAEGVSSGDCVVSSTGVLLGVVESLGSHWAQVILVSDPGFSMGGTSAGEVREPGLLTGDFSLLPKGQLKLSFLPLDTQAGPGDEVLTLSGEGLYPSGLLVGTLTRVDKDPGGMEAFGVVRPAAEVADLSQVFVITDFSVHE